MPKVCFVSLNAYKLFDPHSNAHIGGTELQMYNIAQLLSREDDFDISFVVGDFGQNSIQRLANISVYASFMLKKSIKVFIMAPLIIFRLLWRIRPDVIISSPAGPEIAFLAIYARLVGARYVYRIASDVDSNGEKQKQMGLLGGILYRLGIALAHTLIAQHTEQQKMLQHVYGKSSILIPNIYISSAHGSHNAGNSRIIWIGSSRHVKRIDLLFEIARRMPEYSFGVVLSHSGDEKIFRNSKSKAQELPNIEFLGELSVQETEKELQASSILLGTSDYEGFPNTYLQAFFNHVPVVSLHVNPQGIFNNSRLGICTGGDLIVTEQTLRQIMQSEELRNSIAQGAYRYAQSKHDSTKIIQRWISLIRTKHYSLSEEKI